jgi:hypothetical protein
MSVIINSFDAIDFGCEIRTVRNLLRPATSDEQQRRYH